MVSPRRMVWCLFGLMACGWLVSWAWAQAHPAPAATLPVVAIEAKRLDGVIITAKMPLTTITLISDYGKHELNLTKVKQIDLSPGEEDGQLQASVTTTDKSHLTGPLFTTTLALQGYNEPLKLADLRTLKLKHPKEVSWLAAILGLITLTAMEIVLGVDNIIFLAIVAGKLPEPQQPSARRIGLAAALGTRLLLLASLSWLLMLTEPLFMLPKMPLLETLEARGISGRDLILLVGGIFLIGKSVKEMHDKLEAARDVDASGPPARQARFWAVIVQIAVIDIIFSLDSVITAVGMVDEIWVMITAMLLAVGVMIVFAEPIARFVDKRPTVKILALSFLILIGVLLVAEGLGQHLDKGYIYFAMAFAVLVELINMQFRTKPPTLVADSGQS